MSNFSIQMLIVLSVGTHMWGGESGNGAAPSVQIMVDLVPVTDEQEIEVDFTVTVVQAPRPPQVRRGWWGWMCRCCRSEREEGND